MNQLWIEDILAEYANGGISLADLRLKYDIRTGSELDLLLHLAAEIESVLVQVAPAPEFVAQLRRELLHDQTADWRNRFRQLSPLQVGGLAAGIGGITVATAAGILWYASRVKRSPLAAEVETSSALIS